LPNVFDDLNNLFNYNYDVIYGNVQVGDSNTIWKCKNINFIFYDMPFSHQAVLTKKSILINNLFNLNYSIAADYDLFLKLYLNKYNFFKTNIIFAHYDTNGISSSNIFKILYEYCTILKLNSNGYNRIIRPCRYLINKRSFLFYILLKNIKLLSFARKIKNIFIHKLSNEEHFN
jgi:hypothetical protein